MKKLLALVLTLCLCLSAVAALASGDGVTLKLGIYPEDVDTAAIDAHDNVYIPAIEAALPGLKVEKAHYKYATDTFVALVESRNMPTIIESWYTEPQKLIAGGFVADVTDALAELGWLDKMNPSVRALLSDANGQVYGTPRDGYALGLMINAELFRDAGLVDDEGVPLYPKTWDELVEVGLKIKEETGSAALCLLAQDNAGGWHFSNIAWAFGAQLEAQDADGKWVAQLNTPEVAAAMQYVRDLKWEYDLLTSDPTTENWGTGFSQLATGSAAMYIAANDAVNQPTAVNGLPLEDLMLVGVPAGPGGQFSLSGGTPYVFSATATKEEIAAALKYLEIMGKSPVLSDAAKQGLVEDAKYRVENGIPVIPDFPAWADEELSAAKAAVVAEYSNIDLRYYAPYFEATTTGTLHMEEPAMTQEMYGELTKVLQEVLTNESADIQALLDTANANLQQILDDNLNK